MSRIKGRPHYYSNKKEEYAQFRFDLDAGMDLYLLSLSVPNGTYIPWKDKKEHDTNEIDLSPLFNWNTKQLFVYVLASYSSSDSTPSSVPNSESIIWDAIIPAPVSPYSVDSLRDRFLPSKSSSSSSSSKRRSSSLKNKNKKNTNTDANTKKDAAAPGVLHLRNQRGKYQISDITGKMAERRNVTLSVGWNVQPWVGALWWSPASGAVPRTKGGVGRSKAFDFPALKGSKKEGAGQKASV